MWKKSISHFQFPIFNFPFPIPHSPFLILVTSVLLCRHLKFYSGKEVSTYCSFCLSVNNAGYGFLTAVECVPISMAQDMFNVNFFGTLRLIKAVLPSMKARQSGHIINNTSMAGIVGLPFMDIYSASKFAVEGLSESLAPLLRQFDIR